jgi:glyoxylase-like metal-dependent hydrolase (beta-lactamase superfamily II)
VYWLGGGARRILVTMEAFTLGDVEIVRIEETHGPVGMTQEQFVPGLPEEAWRRHEEMLVPDHVDPRDGLVQVAMQSWVLRSGGRTIVVDTGVGNGKKRPAVPVWNQRSSPAYLAGLASAGIRPEDVDLVVNTHLHVDHVGWNTMLIDGEWVPTFPNATYLMPQADFEFWNPANNPNIPGGVNENVYEDSVAPVHEAGQVKLWQDEYVIDADLTLEPAPGHTPGSSVLKLQSGSDLALLAGDVVHCPVQIPEPEYNSCFCEDPAAARAVRKRLLGWAADRKALVLPAHFSGEGAVTVEHAGQGFKISSWGPFAKL